MHITDGILSAPVIAVGTTVAIAGTAYGLRKLKYENIPGAAVFTATFFVTSLIHIPVGISSSHLILNGLIGIIFGAAAFPMILIGLTLQSFFFGFGGLTTLGVNTAVMALPGWLCYLFFNRILLKTSSLNVTARIGFYTGFISILLSSVFYSLAYYFSDEKFLSMAVTVLLAHIPVIILEGLITAFILVYIKKVNPEILSMIK